MTELEKLERAKMYIDKLANGINPLDNSLIPDHEIVNHVRISRCFFYVSDVLRQAIENRGIASTKKAMSKAPKEQFYLSCEKRTLLRPSDLPIPISEITKRINELSESENMKKLSYKKIREWLLEIEMLQIIPGVNGKNKIIPSENGQKLGIFLEERFNSKGPYTVIVYNSNAQQFIYDNLDAVM